ncbi:MAG: exonuclease SbcCD subunit D [Oscillospiraceae bacterium]|jgi:exonuclease SbcD|nr:exonuclease SbcCD subunit D [Oscillospiraceae bacterium]
MTIIHLSDLHIGKSLHGFSLLEDQKHILDAIAGDVIRRSPGAVIIAGDVYDKPVPSVEAVRVFDDFLTRLAGGGAVVFIISGNHDSPERLCFAGNILGKYNIHFCGSFDGTLKSVTLADHDGGIRFHMLPFIKPSHVRRFFGNRAIESANDAVAAVLSTARLDGNAKHVLIAHQFVSGGGCEPATCESESISVGGTDAVDPALFAGFDYVALGHLHGPQYVFREHIRYCGAPLKYSFDEARQNKSVTVVTLDRAGARPAITEAFFSPLRDVRTLRGTLAGLTDEARIPREGRDDYIHIVLTDNDAGYDAIGKIRRVYPNSILSFDNARTGAPSDFSQAVRSTRKRPAELFASLFEEQNGRAMTGSQQSIIEQVIRDAEAGP